ncbi:DnaD domain protein [Staphylococcus simulans]|uniref:DnaD domain protein n=1 Tax=Staphylococcus simulans TaxID=1286 RepID=UPI000D1DD6BF|nr:DnaD domain protein [Staphylococcus simulans]PTJ88933.1 replication protein [Staphylococcus simulans]
MESFEKYNLSQVKTERFYQLPKYLFEDPYFKKMSAEAKIMYALLKDRFELSIHNEWVDDKNNIYFIFSNKNLCEYLGYGEQKIIKLKKELIKFNLLLQERVGLNKPNRLYLLKPKYPPKTSNDKELPFSQFRNCENGSSGTMKMEVQKQLKSQSNDTKINDTEKERNYYNKSTQNSSKTILKYICTELNIKTTKAFEIKLHNFIEQFDLEIIEYAVEYAGLKGTNPKQYLIKILETWLNNDVKTLQQAKNFRCINKKQTKSKEITPDWLKNRIHEKRNGTKKHENDGEIDPDLKKDKETFLQHLKDNWG